MKYFNIYGFLGGEENLGSLPRSYSPRVSAEISRRSLVGNSEILRCYLNSRFRRFCCKFVVNISNKSLSLWLESHSNLDSFSEYLIRLLWVNWSFLRCTTCKMAPMIIFQKTRYRFFFFLGVIRVLWFLGRLFYA